MMTTSMTLRGALFRSRKDISALDSIIRANAGKVSYLHKFKNIT